LLGGVGEKERELGLQRPKVKSSTFNFWPTHDFVLLNPTNAFVVQCEVFVLNSLPSAVST